MATLKSTMVVLGIIVYDGTAIERLLDRISKFRAVSNKLIQNSFDFLMPCESIIQMAQLTPVGRWCQYRMFSKVRFTRCSTNVVFM